MSDINLADYKQNEKDTGSSNYQVAVLTERIIALTEHLKSNKKDVSSRRGLLKMVAKRRKHLDYVRSKSEEDYKKLLEGLKLRR
ncbi:MAG: 30S ribosomal protein S15 [Akkermansiaceae bacterium]